jgi:hypothetical protein
VSVEKSLVEESLAFTTPMFASEQTVVGTAKKNIIRNTTNCFN